MRKAIVIFHAFVSILLLVALPGRTQTPVKEARSDAVSDARMRSLLSGMAFDFTEDSTGGATTFAFQVNGPPVTLRTQANGLSLSACFKGAADLMKANQWNREHFSTRAYLDEKGCASLGADVRFGGGGPTDQMVRDFVRQFCTAAVVFVRFLENPPGGLDSRSPAPAPAIEPLHRPASPIGSMAWSQVGPHAKRTPPQPATTGSIPGLLKIDSKVSLKYDSDLWKPAGPRRDGRFAFTHASGASYALVISERTAVPLGSIEDVALANAQSVDPHASVVFRNRRWANGVTFCILKIQAAVETIPMVYWGYFYVGEGGTVQVVTYTEERHFPKYEQVLTDFLNGLTM